MSKTTNNIERLKDLDGFLERLTMQDIARLSLHLGDTWVRIDDITPLMIDDLVSQYRDSLIGLLQSGRKETAERNDNSYVHNQNGLV